MWDAGDHIAVRAIVLTGSRKEFCAGFDLGGIALDRNELLIKKAARPFDLSHRADYQARRSYFAAIPKATITMINVANAEIGLLFALFCDLRIASGEAVLRAAFSRLGLVSEHGMAWAPCRFVGNKKAVDLSLSWRRARGGEAPDAGLVNQIHPSAALSAATYAIARDLATSVSARSLGVIKGQLRDLPSKACKRRGVSDNQQALLSDHSDDFKEGFRAFAERRAPRC